MSGQIEVDNLSLDYIQKQLKKGDVNADEKEILKAIDEMLKDCDDGLIDLIESYI